MCVEGGGGVGGKGLGGRKKTGWEVGFPGRGEAGEIEKVQRGRS